MLGCSRNLILLVVVAIVSLQPLAKSQQQFVADNFDYYDDGGGEEEADTNYELGIPLSHWDAIIHHHSLLFNDGGAPADEDYRLQQQHMTPLKTFSALEWSARDLIPTVTLTLATSWYTQTVTTTTTCTTSTANIKVCSPSKGRRRRGNFAIHRLMFDEEDFDEIFAPRNPADDDQLHQQQQHRIPEPILPHHQLKPAAAGAAALETVPFIIQPGFGGSDYVPQGRLFVKFGTSTGVTTTTSTYFYFLTATCRSTTWFQVCSGLGSNIGGNLG